MKAFLVVKTGSTLPELASKRGDYEDWIAHGLGREIEVCHVAQGSELPDPEPFAGIVVTGSSALVTERADWSERTGRWLVSVVRDEVPLLAICYGHQLLADALGGTVSANQNGREMGTIDIELTADADRDALFAGLPRVLTVQSSHREAVVELPKKATRLASNSSETNQAYAVGRRAWGVQFHPEWDHAVIRAYLASRRDALLEEGLDADGMLAAAKASSHGTILLNRFATLAEL